MACFSPCVFADGPYACCNWPFHPAVVSGMKSARQHISMPPRGTTPYQAQIILLFGSCPGIIGSNPRPIGLMPTSHAIAPSRSFSKLYCPLPIAKSTQEVFGRLFAIAVFTALRHRLTKNGPMVVFALVLQSRPLNLPVQLASGFIRTTCL